MRVVNANDCDPQYLDAVADLERQSFADAWSAQSFAAERQAGRLWYAFEDERLVGYLVMWKIDCECEIANLAVDPACRRQGVGTALLTHALGCGATYFYLEVRISNIAARALYHKHGFVQYAVRKNYYRYPKEDALLLCREVSSC